MFTDDFNIVSHKIYRVEANSKLPDKIKVSTGLHFLNKSCMQKLPQQTFFIAYQTSKII